MVEASSIPRGGLEGLGLSLGVLLYKLITIKPSFQKKGHRVFYSTEYYYTNMCFFYYGNANPYFLTLKHFKYR